MLISREDSGDNFPHGCTIKVGFEETRVSVSLIAARTHTQVAVFERSRAVRDGGSGTSIHYRSKCRSDRTKETRLVGNFF